MRRALTVALLGCLSAAGATGTTVIYDNLGPEDAFSSWVSYTAGDVAMPFTVTDPGLRLDAIALPLFHSGLGEPLGPVPILVLNDSGGLPGSILESIQYTGKLPFSATMLSVNSVQHPLLQAGAQYWITAAPGLPVGWSLSFNLTDFGLMASKPPFSGGDWAAVYASRSAFRVTGEPAAVPEPATMLTAVPLLLFALIRARRH